MPQFPEVREWLALARSERTSPEILREIAKTIAASPAPWTRGTGAALARNPNTPPETLRCLVEEYPAAFCQNPALPLLLLECPDYIEQLSRRARRLLLCQPHLPPSWVQLLPPDNDAEARQAADLHVATAKEIAANAWESELWAYLRRLAQVPHGAGRAAQRELATFGFAPAWSANFGSTDREADDLIPEGIPVERHADIRALLGLDGRARLPLRASHELRQAFHPRTRGSFLRRLSYSKDWMVCLAVASHPGADRETLTELLCRFAPFNRAPEKKPVFELLRAAVLLNPSTPIPILNEFARDANPALRRALRRRPNATRDWTEASREKTRREVQLWSLPEERRPLRHRYDVPCPCWDSRCLYICTCMPFGSIRWSTPEAPPTPLCAIAAIVNCPLTDEERRRRTRAAAGSESHIARIGAVLSPILVGEAKTLELLCDDACRLVRAVARARRDITDWRFSL